MPEPRRRDLRTSGLPSLCGACRWRKNDQFASLHFKTQNDLFLESRRITLLVPVVRGETIGAARRRGRGARKLLLPPGRGKAGMGVERRHSTGQVSTPSPALPLPGGGSQNLGREDFGLLAKFHNAKLLVSHGRPTALADCGVREEADVAPVGGAETGGNCSFPRAGHQCIAASTPGHKTHAAAGAGGRAIAGGVSG